MRQGEMVFDIFRSVPWVAWPGLGEETLAYQQSLNLHVWGMALAVGDSSAEAPCAVHSPHCWTCEFWAEWAIDLSRALVALHSTEFRRLLGIPSYEIPFVERLVVGRAGGQQGFVPWTHTLI